jgi:hypothetical protein
MFQLQKFIIIYLVHICCNIFISTYHYSSWTSTYSHKFDILLNFWYVKAWPYAKNYIHMMQKVKHLTLQPSLHGSLGCHTYPYGITYILVGTRDIRTQSVRAQFVRVVPNLLVLSSCSVRLCCAQLARAHACAHAQSMLNACPMRAQFPSVLVPNMCPARPS